ncbi:hypothetical protein HLB44_09095 [Aquincola sp. S2]|uniref:Uncharacterized protein n=1 Tax=Pseudaquabacterium terrae TaxID=2732868 RepID=A0ABX2EEV5_9BURK|nr:hypothetical protein [Aquabacterium terrae]NRF67136.1 hypothetical protein [Aquabacterium terrae]
MTTLIEADSIDAAISGTRDHLRRLQDERALFRPGTEIVVASCVEIHRPSRDGFVMQLWGLHKSDFIEVSTTLPDADASQAIAFQWCEDGALRDVAEPAVLFAVSESGTVNTAVTNHPRDGPT